MASGALLELPGVCYLLDRVVARKAGDAGRLLVRETWVGIDNSFVGPVVEENDSPSPGCVQQDPNFLARRLRLVKSS